MTNNQPTKPLLKQHPVCINLLSDNSGFKKGMTAYQVRVWGCDRKTGHVKVAIRELQIKSFGKKQGTATSIDKGGEYIQRNLQPEITILAHTMDDARQMAGELGLHESGYWISSEHGFMGDWLSTYRERGAAEALKMAEERGGVSPSYEIVEGV